MTERDFLLRVHLRTKEISEKKSEFIRQRAKKRNKLEKEAKQRI